MAKYLLVESCDPYSSGDVHRHYELAGDLRKDGNEVTLFLVENGVLPARKGPRSERLSALAEAGVEVLADEFALKERGIASERMAPGIKAASLEVMVDHLAGGSKAIWH